MVASTLEVSFTLSMLYPILIDFKPKNKET